MDVCELNGGMWWVSDCFAAVSQYPSCLGGGVGREKTYSRGLVGFCFKKDFFGIESGFLVWFGFGLPVPREGEEGIWCCLRIYCVLDFAREVRGVENC